ncbi:hypothetical protein PNEG_03384 [Pneumocystis murina B123]|uniref:Copper-fist domain-containing protein n=1 Tax=Pneumocystis murina (strain B123) TaxID=1069680 RepID=M7P2Y9_PNEMU|nr:hypothetical protein PNEG_03384 [Pneumocystis murina B123]EMR08215.1 hypothetical protein PNEG_03384 [Pneumocystis murina B123]
MVYINDIKYACSSCIRGHRSSLCDHENRQLFEIKRKGRPVSQCVQMPSERTKKTSRTRCVCNQGLEKSFVSLDVQKMSLKTPKKNKKKVLPMIKNEKEFCGIEKDEEVRDSVQIYSFPTDFNTLNNSLQWIHLSDKSQTSNNMDIKVQDTRLESNGLYDFDSVFCPQSLGSKSESTEMIYNCPQYLGNCLYPLAIEKTDSNFVSIPDQMSFYQTCGKSAYSHFDSLPIYPYMASGVSIDSQVFASEFLGSDQYSKMQNNDDTKILELHTDPQIMISNDFQNFNSGILDVSYPYLLSEVRFDYLSDSTCKCSNCHINADNIPQDVSQTMPMDEKLLSGLYTSPEGKFLNIMSDLNIYTNDF